MTGLRWTKEQLEAHRAKLNSKSSDATAAAGGGVKAKGKPQQKKDGMNRLEAEYAQILEDRKRKGEIAEWMYDAISLRLARSTFYHPDFLVMLPDGTLEIHETKGFMRDDAAVKLKTAAALFPFLTFFLVTKPRGGGWSIAEV